MRFSNSAGRDRRHLAVDINLTNLVDIMFNLLLFFMLTSSIAEHSGINVDLPQASHADSELNAKDLSIVLTSDGSILINDEQRTADQLKSQLEKMPKGSDPRVVLHADKGVPYGRVVEIMDLVKSKGVGHMSIATESGH